MTDTPELLPKSREYFRKFLFAHKQKISEDVREYRVGPGTGYSRFYNAGKIIQIIRNIDGVLNEQFGNLNIPEDFPSPKKLVETWQSFYNYLVKEENLIKEVGDKLIDDAKIKYQKDFQYYYDDGMILPVPFTGIETVLRMVKDVLEHVLKMDEVKTYLTSEKTKDTLIEINKKEQEGFDVAIITALYDTEFEALKGIPGKWVPYLSPNDSSVYFEGKIGMKRVLLATDDKMGMAAASSLSTKIIAKFSPKYLIMSGIAGGVKDKEKKYGDLLVARFTWNYESGKYKYSTKDKLTVFEPYPEQIELDADLVKKINELKSDWKILESIKNSFSSTPINKIPANTLKVFLGPVASGSAVLADDKKVADIRRWNRKLLGIDMETFGVFYAAKSFATIAETKAISIKSISDFANQRKNDKYRNYAAHTSAHFIYELILQKLQ